MAIDGKIRDEKLQYDINRKAANVSAISSALKLINTSILQVKIYYPLINVE